MECNWNSRAGHSLTTALGAFVQSSRAGPRWGAAPKRWSKDKNKSRYPLLSLKLPKEKLPKANWWARNMINRTITWATMYSREHTRWHWTSRLWPPMTHSLAPGTYTPGMPQKNTAICLTPQIQIWSTSFLAVGQRCCIAGSVGGMERRLCKLAEILDARILLTGI